MPAEVQELTGRALDAAVAQRVMGWVYDTGPDAMVPDRAYTQLGPGKYRAEFGARAFRPSEDIAAAWQVVEKLNEQGWTVEAGRDFLGKARCVIWFDPCRAYELDESEIEVFADTAPEAICRAALKAVAGAP